MQNELLDVIKKDPTFVKKYLEARSLLWSTHVFEYLRGKARPRVIALGSNVQVQATEAVFSAGYNECLDDISDFINRILTTQAAPSLPTPDYGGLELAKERGDLTEEDINAIRQSRTQ